MPILCFTSEGERLAPILSHTPCPTRGSGRRRVDGSWDSRMDCTFSAEMRRWRATLADIPEESPRHVRKYAKQERRAMNSNSDGGGSTEAKAPYGPFQTFRNFLEQLSSASVVPRRIDKSVTSNMSGGGRSQLLVALRFFELVAGADDAVTDRLRELVQQSEEGRVLWADSELRARYAGALELSASGGTNAQLREWFEETYGHGGTTAEKAIRFFMQMANYANLELSPLFSLPRAGPARPRNRATQRPEEEPAPPPTRPSPASPQEQWDPAIEAWLKRLPGPEADWNSAERAAWTTAFNAMLDTVYPKSKARSDTDPGS